MRNPRTGAIDLTVSLSLPSSVADFQPVTKDQLCQPIATMDPLAAMDTSMVEGGLNVTLTIRLLMHGKVSAAECSIFLGPISLILI